MKLYLLRHAEAANSFNKGDKERALSPHGIEQAKKVAPYIKAIKNTLCSAAKRTQMTLNNAVDAGANVGEIQIFDKLYNAPAGDVLDVIQKQNAGDILVVAHNPGIHQLANILCAKDSTKEREILRYQYQPATLCILECEIESWSELKPEENKLLNLIVPD